MNELNTFLDGLLEQLAVFEKESPDDQVDWYNQTRLHFKNYYGMSHAETFELTFLMRNYLIRAFRTSLADQLAFEAEERRKAKAFLGHIIGPYTKKKSTIPVSGRKQGPAKSLYFAGPGICCSRR